MMSVGAALAEGLELTDERRDDRVPRRSGATPSSARRPFVAGGSRARSRGQPSQVVEEAHPVAVLLVEAVPHRRATVMAGEVGQERGLAVAGFGDDEQDPVVDLDLQPVEQPLPTQDFPPSGGRWTFAGWSGNSCTTSPPIGNDTVGVDAVVLDPPAPVPADRSGRGSPWTLRTIWIAFRGVNGAIREEGMVGQGHGGVIGGADRSPDAISCDARDAGRQVDRPVSPRTRSRS